MRNLLSPVKILKSLDTSSELEYLKALNDHCTSTPELEYFNYECLKALLVDDDMYQETVVFSEQADKSEVDYFSSEVDYFVSGLDHVPTINTSTAGER
jgi:hypothetical protein